MAALTPFRTALIRPAAVGDATITGTIAQTLGAVTMVATGTASAATTGTMAVTLSAVTMSATGTAGGISGGADGGVGNMVGSLNASGGTAFGGNVVHMLRAPRRRPTRRR